MSRFPIVGRFWPVKMLAMVRAVAEDMGSFLRKRIERLGIKKQAAAAQIGVSDATLRSWFRAYAPSMRPENRVNAAKLLGMSTDEFEAKLEAAFVAQGEVVEKSDLSREPVGNSIEVFTQLEIPEFEASVAAGPWIDLGEIGEVCDPKIHQHGLFVIRLAGDSMEPKYANGSKVLFQCIENAEQMRKGSDYFVQQTSGEATFKSLSKITKTAIELVALNRKYRKEMSLEKTRIGRIAVAKFRGLSADD